MTKEQVFALDPKQHQTLLLGNFQKNSCLVEKLMVNCKAKMEARFLLQISSVVFIVSFPFEQCNLLERKGESSQNGRSRFWGIYP